MNRLSSYLLALSGALALSYPVVAQDVSPTTVSSAPPGSSFVVDGQQYTQPTTFNWATGSKHILQWVPNSPGLAQVDGAGTTKYSFTGWTENTGGLTTGTFLAQT